MMCTDCIQPKEFTSKSWTLMTEHYAKEHPDTKNPGKYFTPEAKKQ